jgi:energy-coupling factor transporter ATP-binding protein EcfA2
MTDVSYTYADRSTPAVSVVSLALHGGETHLICGPSGSGKSTLALLLAKLLTPNSGTVELCGYDSSTVLAVGFVFQFPETLFFADSVAEEFTLLNPAPALGDVQQTLEEIGVAYDELALRHPFQLSVGMGRMTALALQLVRNPQVLIADEPTIGLDTEHSARVTATLKNWPKHDRILVVITHDIDLVRDLGGTVHLLNSGEIGWSGPADELLANHDLQLQFGLA